MVVWHDVDIHWPVVPVGAAAIVGLLCWLLPQRRATHEDTFYVTSGKSNDWEADGPNPETTSGMGREFVMEPLQSARWAILRLLHAMTFQILLCHGRYPGREPLGDYHRLPLRSPIRSEPSALTFLMLAPPTGFPRQAQLDSGPFEFYQLVSQNPRLDTRGLMMAQHWLNSCGDRAHFQ